MREVTLDIAKLGLIVTDTLQIQLVNSVGNVCMSSSGYKLDTAIVLSSTTLSIELLENSYINMLTFYRITLPSGIKFKFSVPFGLEGIPHDMLSLLQLGCYEEIIDKDNNTLSSAFVTKLDLYFAGENPHFTKTELDIVRLYEYYANEIIDTTSTIDIMQMMDEYLATIIGE
ncbi:MAG: hypothetical protein RQ763_00180 [Sulfurimonas sp.]|uniref:hypothetical protein n=1 Tax=Sulfurimonas sp. TaxID=2022749 RepID=UPI0028CD1EAE|nr:hypothetical protein [Sulfurimonas sp.]MDT8337590.1 hypothetical protein [Sulfurimonas sp.]